MTTESNVKSNARNLFKIYTRHWLKTFISYCLSLVFVLFFHRNLNSNKITSLPEDVFAALTDLRKL